MLDYRLYLDSHAEPLGTGYGMLQLSWAGEAFVLDEEGVQAPLDMPALQLMAERKIE